MIQLTERGRETANLCYDLLETFFTEIDAADGLENMPGPDEIYVQRIEDIAKRARLLLSL